MSKAGDFWWLVALEATLFLNLVYWEFTAAYAEPATYPLRFAMTVIPSATVAMLACHCGPAWIAAKSDARWHWLYGVLLFWLGVGYVEWMLDISLFASTIVQPGHRRIDAGLVFLTLVIIAAFVRSWWKLVVGAGVLLGMGILVWALVTSWSGFAVRNPHYSSDGPMQLDWLVAKGILVSAAPAVVIAWRIGKTDSKRILMSGFWGVWLPAVLFVTIASLAAQAGANQHWRPTLFRGFDWALLSSEGKLDRLARCTVFLPALVCVVSLRELSEMRRRGWISTSVTIAGLLLGVRLIRLWRDNAVAWEFASQPHELWALSVVVIGACGALLATRS